MSLRQRGHASAEEAQRVTSPAISMRGSGNAPLSVRHAERLRVVAWVVIGVFALSVAETTSIGCSALART